MIKKVDHVTLVVKNLEEAMKSYGDILHLEPWPQGINDNRPEIRLVMLPVRSGARIELVEPDPALDNRFSRFLRERGEGVFGICVFCEDFDAEIKSLRAKGVKFEEETQDVLFPENPFRLAWVPPEAGHGVWIELVDARALPAFELEGEAAD
ncbi:MAG: VOC family protein [Chloroflexota bacterium]